MNPQRSLYFHMRVEFLDEPELEFAAGVRHIDIRFGLMDAGPLDVQNPSMRTISVGLVGTTDTIEGMSRWLERCRGEVPAKQSAFANLFPGFPGFRPDVAFRSSLILESRTQRAISQRELAPIVKATRSDRVIEDAVGLFLEEMRNITESSRPDVLLCAPPAELWDVVKGERTDNKSDGENSDDAGHRNSGVRRDFHDLLKARAMARRTPVQLVWPATYDVSKRRRQKRRPNRAKGVQDEATRAWNLHTAIYYKSGGIPWRLVRDSTQLTSCCVGISFYRSLDGNQLLTSMAQIFNERGEGVVVRGGQAAISKDDRQPHLEADDAKALLDAALTTYRKEHKNLPARIVLHKTSRYSESELNGFRAAAEEARIEEIDMLSLDDSFVRLYREGENPPLRGTMLSLDARTHVLYTRGSVDFFELYPGMYVPLPLRFRCEETIQTPRFLGRELLALTKMNWNTTQFDGREPITVLAAQKVGAILRQLGDADPLEPAFSHYM